MAKRQTTSWTAVKSEPTPLASDKVRTPSAGQPALPPIEPTPANGWDLLDEYQLGKDVSGADAAQTARITARFKQDQQQQPAEDDASSRGRARSGTEAVAKTTPFWRRDGSAAQDAEVMARIMAREQQNRDLAQQAVARAKATAAEEERELVRERQRREIDDYLALQGRRATAERQLSTSLQQMMQDAADIFLALGICPDHLEYMPELGKFCSWGGRLYDHQEIFAMRDERGQEVYSMGPSPEGTATTCFSQRERRWRLHQGLPPGEHLTPVERLLPVPRRHPDGSVRFSASRARTIQMEEGSVYVYVVRNAVFTVSHLRAAHFRHAVEEQGVDPNIAAAMAKRIGAPADEAAAEPTPAASIVDTAAKAVTRAITSTTRLWRRRG